MKFRFLGVLIFVSFNLFSQTKKYTDSPKLVVGVVVDQMRFDYISRFYLQFGNDGFKRLINEGFECRNHHFNYMPTYTGPGHASIFTGTSPQNHGIIGNNWYDKFEDKVVYCASDADVKTLGTDSPSEKMSPKRILTMTLGDANRLHTQFKGKTIGVSIKNRGAILPAGHSANGAYWFRGKEEGQWISTNYYNEELPKWVKNFNNNKTVNNYLKQWNTLYPIESYLESGKDLNNYEIGFEGKETATFPYDLKSLKKKNSGYDILKYTPYGNSIVTDFVLEAIEKEGLGADDVTDVLTVSFSSTDYIGHNFGVNSVEIEDTYIRLDLELAKLLAYLDTKVGKGEYTLFLTADHGAVHVPQYLSDRKIPAYYFNQLTFDKGIKQYLKSVFKIEGLVKNISNQQVFLNYKLLEEEKISLNKVIKKLQFYISQQKYVQYVFTRGQLSQRSLNNATGQLVQNGFHQRLSGDIAYVLTPATITYPKKGSTHGSPQNYDTHVPMLFFGKGVNQGRTFKKTRVIDIVPTVCSLLGIASPNGTTGEVLDFIIK